MSSHPMLTVIGVIQILSYQQSFVGTFFTTG